MVKEQDTNYTFTIFEKLTDETDNTTDFFENFTTTDLINQSSINITTTDQSTINITTTDRSFINITTTDQSFINITTTDRIELIPTNLSFQIHVTKSGFGVKLNDKGMDVNEQMLNYPAKVPVHNIQYITVEHKNITLTNGTAVEVSCVPEANCVNKR
uniref:Hyphal_reg_CWP domain-containing protein n=1 Tax=Globodera pallida TaxID=36090 RepID=A0A183CCJ6_GLOPA